MMMWSFKRLLSSISFDISIFIVILFCLFCTNKISANNGDLLCSACRVLVHELEQLIKLEDQEKTIDSGSFRVDNKGNTLIKKVPFARSDTHLTKLLDEDICDRVTSTYGLMTDDSTGIQSFVTSSDLPPGKIVDSSKVQFNPQVTGKLKSLCHTLVDDHFDVIKDAFVKSEATGIILARNLCLTDIQVCSEEILSTQFVAPYIDDPSVGTKSTEGEQATDNVVNDPESSSPNTSKSDL